MARLRSGRDHGFVNACRPPQIGFDGLFGEFQRADEPLLVNPVSVLEKGQRPFVILQATQLVKCPTLKVGVVGGGVVGLVASLFGRFLSGQIDFEGANDLRSHLVLEIEDVVERTVIALGP